MTEERVKEIERAYSLNIIKEPSFAIYVRELIAEVRKQRKALEDIAHGRVEGDYSDMRDHAREALYGGVK